MRRTLLHVLSSFVLCSWSLSVASADDSEAVDFVRDVRPIFEQHCVDCHGGETREAGLRLDRSVDALAGSDSGKVIVPHKPGESRILELVSGSDPETVMPPDSEGLPEDQVALLRRWIEQGAEWPASADAEATQSSHWAFQPIVRAEPPDVAGDTVRNAIDAFVQALLAAEGIDPSPEADRATLIKRLYYDLTGLPPSPESVDRFMADESPTAYEDLVDELLASEHFGERWGRHWLDIARYADSDGYEKDNPRYNAWKYRDWVIKAINDDMPFDQFTIEQLAGDLLPEATPEMLLATAFNRQTLTNTEGGTDQEQFRVEAVFDRTETLGTAWLGLTIGCARCHTHKYDPISQREYYQLFAFFNNGDESTTPIASDQQLMDEYLPKKAAFDQRLAELSQPLAQRREELSQQLTEWEAEQQIRIADYGARPQTFHTLLPTSARSENGAELTIQDDGVVLAGGERPVQDVYVLETTFEMPEITGLRLDVLTDEAFPAKGPGRADNGNFVLSEITATVADEAQAEPVTLKFASARADHSQNDFGAAKVIDGVEDKTGWAVAPQMGKDHFALFTLADDSITEVAALEGPRQLTVRLSQQYEGSPHTIGKFRLSAVTGLDPESLGLPENIRQALAVAPGERNDDQKSALLDYYAGLDETYRSLKSAVDEFKKSEPFKPEMVVRIIKERMENRRETRMFKRGEFLDPLDPVQPGTLEALNPLPDVDAERAANRLDLARWLVSRENPLTPRVTVNHIWQRLFGRGLVKTSNDFGTRGEEPTHPLLLDWLADEFMRVGWSRKTMIKTIVMSHTYRQSSRFRPELAEVDPQNRLLARQNRTRVEAEIVRDLHLAVSGLLDRRVGGPSVFPPLPPGIAELSYANNFKWGNSNWNTRPDRPGGVAPSEDVYRRGMYTFFKRTAPHPNLTTFDCPDANLTAVERSASNTPLQALITLNNEVFVDAARGMARRVLTEGEGDDGDRIAWMLRLVAVRTPSAGEVAEFGGLLASAREYYAAHPEAAVKFAGPELPEGVDAAEAAAWTATARIVMNLDEFIVRD